MSAIKVVEQNVIYENPVPYLRSRQGYFPGVVPLSTEELLALVVIGEAFESVDLTTHVSRSYDTGRNWHLEGPLYDKTKDIVATSDFLKPTLLRNDSLVAIGYRFYRRNIDESLVNPETGGVLPGDDVVSFSNDRGHTWSRPEAIPLRRLEFLEISGPCIELRSGDLLASGCPFPTWKGENPSGKIGVLLRSSDRGRTWDDQTIFFKTADDGIIPYESRLCEMEAGHIVAIVWAYDCIAKKSLPNYVTVSHDNGKFWSVPVNTDIMGQASNLIWLGEDLLLTIHAQREGETGLYVRIVEFKNDRWRVIAEKCIWDRVSSQKNIRSLLDMSTSLKFGQPSLLPLKGTDNIFLAAFWCSEEGQGRVLTYKLQVDL